MVHRRELDGRELVFGNQGALYLNAMTWWDHETGSIWSQPLGQAIAGPLTGATLELVPSTLTQWGAWREAHPETVALDAFSHETTLDLEQVAIVVEIADDIAAYPVPELRAVGVANDTVGGVDIAVVIDPADEQRWTVFARRLADRVVEVEVVDGRLRDLDSGSEFDPVSGIALSGVVEGEVLGQVAAFTAFPRDYAEIWPDGRVWRP